MKRILFYIPLMLLVVLTGCRSTIKVNDKSFYMLRDSEIDELISTARYTLRVNSSKQKIITDSELRYALNNQPDVQIEYFGDCLGNARISWQFPERKTTVLFRGELNNEHNRFIAVSLQEKQPEVIDASGLLPSNSGVLKNKSYR